MRKSVYSSAHSVHISWWDGFVQEKGGMENCFTYFHITCMAETYPAVFWHVVFPHDSGGIVTNGIGH